MKTDTTVVSSLFELNIFDGSSLIFRGYFGPLFPHPKNIYQAISDAKAIAAECLFEKLKHTSWEKVNIPSRIEYKQAVVINRRKIVLRIQEYKHQFHATVPMCLYAYDPTEKK
jgi:hypothetical protein